MSHRRARRIVLATTALFAVALLAACGPAAPPAPTAVSTSSSSSSSAAADIVARHNTARASNGLGALVTDGAMQANAQFHANRLVAGASSCSGAVLWHSPELASWYPGMSAAENAACVPGCPNDGATAMGMWLGSSYHRANVLGPGYTRIGVATACNGSVQMVVAHYRSG